MEPLKIGIAGAGFAARFHLENFPESGIEVVGVTSARPESREAFAAKHKLRAFASVEEMLPEIDVLDICTPPSSHQTVHAGGGARRQARHRRKTTHGVLWLAEKPLVSAPCWMPWWKPGANCGRRARSGITLGYAENFVYAPSVQKEREIIERSRAQILRMAGEESHNGSHSPVYGIWSVQGGGSLIAKGCHPLGAILYLKRKEGLARLGRPLRPAAVSARTHSITSIPSFEDRGFLRTKYQDTEDYASPARHV